MQIFISFLSVLVVASDMLVTYGFQGWEGLHCPDANDRRYSD
jgi:hypothetical protein